MNLGSPSNKSELQDQANTYVNPDTASGTNTISEQMNYIRWRQKKLEVSAFKQTKKDKESLKCNLVEEDNDKGVQLLSPISRVIRRQLLFRL